MRTHISYILIILGLILLSVFLFNGGCNKPVTSTKEYKDLAEAKDAANRLILAKNDTLAQIEKRYSEDNRRTSEIIVQLTAEKEQISDVTDKLKGSVSDITKMYRQARKEADTAVALLLADNQSNICDAYVWQSQRELYAADSIIILQKKSLASKDDLIQGQIKFRNDFIKASHQKDDYNNTMIYLLRRDNKKLNNWWNRWGSKVAAGAVGGLAGYAVGTMAK